MVSNDWFDFRKYYPAKTPVFVVVGNMAVRVCRNYRFHPPTKRSGDTVWETLIIVPMLGTGRTSRW
ncbi:MAG: hypothetical protein SPI30_07595 [Prevotella sp.]|nr:hypothetical protein [Prevotella sp.]